MYDCFCLCEPVIRWHYGEQTGLVKFLFCTEVTWLWYGEVLDWVLGKDSLLCLDLYSGTGVEKSKINLYSSNCYCKFNSYNMLKGGWLLLIKLAQLT